MALINFKNRLPASLGSEGRGGVHSLYSSTRLSFLSVLLHGRSYFCLEVSDLFE